MPVTPEERHDAGCEHSSPKPPKRARIRARLPKVPASPGKLSPHFNVREFHCKDGTRVPAVAIPALERLCIEVLEPLRKEFGTCSVMSGYRHRRYNAKIGGAKYSQHIYDLGPESVAADLIFARGTPRQWYAAAEKLLRGRGGIGRYDSFIHVDNRSEKARWTG